MNIDGILMIIGTFISYLNITLIYGVITKSKYKVKPISIIIMIVMAVLNTFVSTYLPVACKTIYNFLCLIVLNYNVYKAKLKDVIYYVFFIWAAGILLDMIFMMLFSVVLEKIMVKMPVFGIFFISLFLQVLLYLVFRIKKVCQITNKLKSKIFMVNNIVWLFILSVFLIVLFSVLAFINLRAFNNVSMIILIALIVLSLIIFFIKLITDEKMYKLAITNLINNNKYYLELNQKNSVFRHNLIHRLNSIKSVSDKKTNSLIDDLIGEYKISSSHNKDVELLPNGINGLICSYIYGRGSGKLNIVINNYIESELFESLTPRRYNRLCETLGVCLDNAVTASAKSKEKMLQIVLLENEKSIIIKIINTFSTSLEIEKIGTKNYTTNSKGHGIGLNSIIRRKEVGVKTSIINNLFENQITVKKKKDKN